MLNKKFSKLVVAISFETHLVRGSRLKRKIWNILHFCQNPNHLEEKQLRNLQSLLSTFCKKGLTPCPVENDDTWQIRIGYLNVAHIEYWEVFGWLTIYCFPFQPSKCCLVTFAQLEIDGKTFLPHLDFLLLLLKMHPKKLQSVFCGKFWILAD